MLHKTARADLSPMGGCPASSQTQSTAPCPLSYGTVWFLYVWQCLATHGETGLFVFYVINQRMRYGRGASTQQPGEPTTKTWQCGDTIPTATTEWSPPKPLFRSLRYPGTKARGLRVPRFLFRYAITLPMSAKRTTGRWVVYERRDGEFIFLSRLFATRAQAEKERDKLETTFTYKVSLGVGAVAKK